MKRFIVTAAVLACLLVTPAFATDPGPLPSFCFNYQGKLTTTAGQPIPDGAHQVAFGLFPVDTGGAALWSTTKSVQTAGGIFSVTLGPVSGQSFFDYGYGPLSVLGDNRWLEIAVDGGTLSPRTKLASVPYAGIAGIAMTVPYASVGTSHISPAGSVDGQVLTSRGTSVVWATPSTNADLLDGLDSTQFMRADQSTGTTGNLTVAAQTTTGVLSVTSNATVGGSLTVTNTAQIGGTASVGGTLTAAGVTSNGLVTANQGLLVQGSEARFRVPVVMENSIQPQIGSTYGIAFPTGYGGDTGDTAYLRYYASGRGATAMNLDLGIANDANDQINLVSSGGVYIPTGGLNITGPLNFYNGSTQVGDISAPDTTWLRINQNTAKPIYTPQLIRADGGLYVGGTTYGISSTGNVFSPQVDTNLLRDRDDVSYIVDPSGSSRLNNLTVTGTLTATIPPGSFVSRYLLKVGDEQTFTGDLINTSGGNYRNPLASSTGCISTQMFSSPYYYGPDATSTIYIGETNPIIIRGSIQTPIIRDRDNTAYYVDPASTSNVNDLTVNGTLSTPTGSSVPLAYGYIKSNGDKQACTTNVGAVTWNGGYYQIHITGVIYANGIYVTTVTPVTPVSGMPIIPMTDTVGTDLKVTLYGLSGGPAPADFQFVVYKP